MMDVELTKTDIDADLAQAHSDSRFLLFSFQQLIYSFLEQNFYSFPLKLVQKESSKNIVPELNKITKIS